MQGEPKPGSGPRKCSFCGYEWNLKAGELDNCPRCGHPYIIEGKMAEGPSVVPMNSKYLHVPPKTEIVMSDRQTSPREELERTQKNIRRSKGLDEPIALTVGDLSFVETSKRKNRVKDGMRRLENMEKGLTVGDRSWATAQKDSRGLDGLCVGQGVYVAPSMSESQEVQADMMAKHQKDQEEIFKIRQMIFEQQQESQARKDAAEARRRRDHEQVDKEVADLLRKR
jgi:hypothetical protein